MPMLILVRIRSHSKLPLTSSFRRHNYRSRSRSRLRLPILRLSTSNLLYLQLQIPSRSTVGVKVVLVSRAHRELNSMVRHRIHLLGLTFRPTIQSSEDWRLTTFHLNYRTGLLASICLTVQPKTGFMATTSAPI